MCGREIRIDTCGIIVADVVSRAGSDIRTVARGTGTGSRGGARAAEILRDALRFGFAALEGLEEGALLLEFVFGHFFLDTLEDAEAEDAAHHAGELGAFTHGFGEAGAEG